MTADRLVLVADGMAKEFSGTLDDYQDLVMGRVSEKRTGKTEKKPVNKKEQRRITAEKRNHNKILRKAVSETETNMNRLNERRTAIDQALFKPAEATGEFQDIATSDLMKLRANVERALVKAESKWLKASEALEQAEVAVG